MKENNATDLIIRGDQSLVIPEGALALAGLSTPAIFESPMALVLVMRKQGIHRFDSSIYSNPELLDDEKSLGTRLDEIKNDFPWIIAAFGDSKIDQMLGRYPIINSRFKEDQELLSSIPGALSQVKAVELVLRRLIIDGSVHTLRNSLDSLRAIASHNLYGDIADTIFENKGNILTLNEEQKFITIGQRLLRVKKLLSVQIQEDGEIEKLPTGERDFKGQVALIKARQKYRSMLQEYGDQSDTSRVETLKSDIQALIENLAMSYPHRLKEIKVLYEIPDWGKRGHWVEDDNHGKLSQAESASFLHGGEVY